MAWRGLRRFGQRSQELIGWFVESWRMQGCRCLLIGWLWCTGGGIVGRWICQESWAPPLLNRVAWCVKVDSKKKKKQNPDCLFYFSTFSKMLTQLSQALLEYLSGGNFTIKLTSEQWTYRFIQSFSKVPLSVPNFRQNVWGLYSFKTKDVNLLQWFILPITMYK